MVVAAASDARADGPATKTVESAVARALVPGRVHAKGYAAFIWEKPQKLGKKLGYVRPGDSVALRSTERRVGVGCAGGFVPVEPRGFICLDRSATLDPSDRYVRSMALLKISADALPLKYALSNGTPMYRRLPSRTEWTRSERFLGKPGSHKPLSWGNKGHEKLAEAWTGEAPDRMPFYLRDGGSASSSKPLGLVRRHIPLGSMLAYVRAFEHAGRQWLASADGTVVPADRTRPFRESKFAGSQLTDSLTLPLAWIRKRARPQFVLKSGQAVKTGKRWTVRTHVALQSGPPVTIAGRRYLPTKQPSTAGDTLYIAERDATVVKRRDLPFGVTAKDKWLVVSITQGTLVAYQGTKPVFATLVSPGVGGPPHRGKSPVKTSSTPVGIYRVTYKHRAATMSPEQGENRKFWIADVPYTQYFHAPFALHVAYWHENFGEYMSAGCINVSPQDGKWLFDFTGPRVPEDWNGAAASKANGWGSYVVVVR